MATTIADQYVWWIKDGKLGIGYYSDGAIGSVSVVKEIRIHARYFPASLDSDLTTEPTLPKHLHEGIVARVLEQLHARSGNLNSARYWRAEYRDYVRSGIKYRNKNRDGTPIAIVQHDK